MRYAAKVFAPYPSSEGLQSSARPAPRRASREFKVAEEFCPKMVSAELHGHHRGGDGIMGAAQKRCRARKSFGSEHSPAVRAARQHVIDGDPKLINFNYFFTRKLNFVKETHAFALFPGGFGTMDEGFEVLTLMQTGKARIIPVVLWIARAEPIGKPG